MNSNQTIMKCFKKLAILSTTGELSVLDAKKSHCLRDNDQLLQKMLDTHFS